MIRFVMILLLVVVTTPARAQTEIAEVTSPAGITAWLVEEPAFPFVAIHLGFRGGTSLDPADKGGATNLMIGLLEEGAGDMSAADFKRASEELAANFGFSARRDSVTISARVLKSNLDASLDLLQLAITNPTFGDVAFERVKNQVLSGLETDETDPHAIAGRALSQSIFGAHAYGQPTDGTLDSVAALTPDDIRAAHRAALSKDHLVVGVVGDITAQELGPLLDRLVGDLPDQGAALPPRVDFQADGGIKIIDFPTPQSIALWAQPGIDRHAPDFFQTYLMMHILGGGGFGSRLTDEVREERGLTYGIYSYIATLDHGNYFGGSVSSSNDRIAEAIAVTRAEWARMANDGVTEEELQTAKDYLTGSYPLRFDSNAKIARGLVGLQLDNLPIDYVNTRNDQVNAVTLDQVNQAARDYLDEPGLQFVIVGQPEGITAVE